MNSNPAPLDSDRNIRVPARSGRLNTSYFGLMQDSSIRIFPPVYRQKSFHWGYVLGQALKRLDPRSYF